MRIFVLFILSLSLAQAHECEIKTHSKIYHLGVDQDQQPSLYHFSNCPNDVLKSFRTLLLASSGTTNAQALAQLIQENTTEQVLITPDRIQIFDLSLAIEEKLQLDQHWVIRNLATLDQKAVLLNEDEWLDIHCDHCHRSGERNLQIIIQSSSTGKKITRYAKAEFKIRTQALVAKANLRASMENLKKEDFEIQLVESIKPENFFVDYDKLIFYRLNRPLSQGESLQHSDLTPSHLVQPGTPAKVILRRGGLSLSTLATPLRSGRFGETIQLINPDSQKMIMGKVVDFNKVEVTQ